MAAAEASFRILIFSISLGFKNAKGFDGVEEPSTPLMVPFVELPSKGTPSTTNKGPLPLETELVPLMLMLIAPPGSPLAGVTVTPAVRPWKSSSGEAMTPLLKDLSPKETTEPVASLTLRVPYPITTISFNCSVVAFNEIVTLV